MAPPKTDPSVHFWAKVQWTPTCWLWTKGLDRYGYGQFRLSKVPSKMVGAHRFAYTLLLGPIPKGKMVLHSCDVRHCVNPAHLRLGTAKDNSQDAVSRQRNPKGEQHGRATLTDKDVAAIRAMPGTSAHVAKLFGVSDSYVRAIRRKVYRR